MRSRKDSVFQIQRHLSVNSEENEKRNSISASQFQDWFDILVMDDIESAEALVETVSKTELKILLNSAFDFEDPQGFGRMEINMEKVNLPFHVAVGCNSKAVADIMLKNEVDILGVNQNNNNNVLHSVVVMAFNNPGIEKDTCKSVKWLMEQLDYKTITTLLFHENSDGLRPIELAAQQGCLRLMKTMFETKGHVTNENVLGLGVYRMHDITDYELGDRHGVSPISMIAYLDEKKLLCNGTTKVIMSPLVQQWIKHKIKSNMPLVIIWFLMRAAFVTVYIILDLDIVWLESEVTPVNNQTTVCHELSYVKMGPTGNIFLSIFLIVYSIGTVIIYVGEMYISWKLKRYKKAYNMNGKKRVVSNSLFFRWQQGLLVFIMLTAGIQNLHILNSAQHNLSGNNFLLRDINRTFIPVVSLWSICFFLQLSSRMGQSIISIQGMLEDLGYFMLLFVLMMLPFVHVFQSFALANSLQGCIADFRNTGMTSYTLFKTMLNIYDPSALLVRNIGVLYILHILYVFMVGVLLINFLIAMMSEKAGEIADDENVILKINQLSIIVVLEERIFCLPKVAKWLYGFLRKRSFFCVDKNVYIKSVGCRFKQLYKENRKIPKGDKY